jgi:hypothetical protein
MAPLRCWLFDVALTGFEPVTPTLKGWCSNQLRYRAWGAGNVLFAERGIGQWFEGYRVAPSLIELARELLRPQFH